MNRRTPTEQERIALQRIEAGRASSLSAILVLGGLMLLLQLLRDRADAVSVVVSVVLVLGMGAILVYRACFLRCPRCSGWIAVPKCPSCGLAFDEPASHRKPADV